MSSSVQPGSVDSPQVVASPSDDDEELSPEEVAGNDYITACFSGNNARVRQLLDNGVSIDHETSLGMSGMMTAVLWQREVRVHPHLGACWRASASRHSLGCRPLGGAGTISTMVLRVEEAVVSTVGAVVGEAE